MDKKSVPAPTPKPEEALAEAKKKFDRALAKTNDEMKAEEAEEKTIIETVKATRPDEAKAAPEKAQPSWERLELERIKRELAEARAKLEEKAKPAPQPEPEASDY